MKVEQLIALLQGMNPQAEVIYRARSDWDKLVKKNF